MGYMFGWGRRKARRRSCRASSVTKHYLAHKEEARELVLARLAYFNTHYNYSWNRVAIRNQRRCWGSCTSLKNLNFNYKILLLPQHLRDYIIVHELCHLKELNHGANFWALVAEQVPEYKKCIAELRGIDKLGHSVAVLTMIQARYQAHARASVTPVSDAETMSEQLCESCGRSVVCTCSVATSSVATLGHQVKRHLVALEKK